VLFFLFGKRKKRTKRKKTNPAEFFRRGLGFFYYSLEAKYFTFPRRMESAAARLFFLVLFLFSRKEKERPFFVSYSQHSF